MKRILVVIIVVGGISTIIALGLAELVVKTFVPQLTFNRARSVGLRIFQSSDITTFALQSNLQTKHIGYTREFDHKIEINGLGFRGKEIPPKKAENTFRILMLGDSMVFGWGVEDDQTIPVHLENYLNSLMTDKTIEVINGGFAAGRSLDSYYAFLRDRVRQLEPDLVMVNIFPYNDFSDLLEMDWVKQDDDGYPLVVKSFDKTVRDGYEVFKKKTNWKYEIPILRNSHVAILTFDFLERKAPAMVKVIKFLLRVGPTPDRTNLEENAKCIYELDCPDKFKVAFEKIKFLLKGFKDLSTSAEMGLLVVIMPEHDQAKPLAQKLELDPQAYLAQHPQKELREDLGALSIEYVDLLPVMAKGKIDTYYFGRDGHLTPTGTQVVAYALLKNLIIDKPLLLKDVSGNIDLETLNDRVRELE